jgi:hypothetical protein
MRIVTTILPTLYFGGYGYRYGHGSVGIIGAILIVVIILMLLGRI